MLKRFASQRLGILCSFALILCPCVWQPLAAAQANTQPLITEAIDEHRLTVLKGNTHPLAKPQFDLGAAPATLPMQRMELVLKRSAPQEFALRRLLDNQQDKHSAVYHKWLTPEDFGSRFGPADSDMQVIATWLRSHGFKVGRSKGRTVLEFSGSASQVQEAFHTAIHRYIVNGEEHWANASDPLIPTALTPAVAGVLTLHNFLKKPQVRMISQPFAGKVRPGKSAALTFSDGSHGMAPADFATIYNSNSLLNLTGTGVTIGVIGRSDVYSSGDDISQFRSNFNLVGGSFTTILNGPDPGDLGGGDEAEATLDTSWSGAVAPGANVDFVVSASTDTTDGTDLSEIYIIENNLADVMTESFGFCEADSSSAQSLGYQLLAEQAAAQGITYFVSTGDNGAEGCDDQDSETVASGPVSVSVLASTGFNVAVGGTTFNDLADPTKYWNSDNTNQESAISYIPENVWNDSCAGTNCTGGNSENIVAGSGGTSIYVGRPSWQTGVAGIGAGTMRELPDVSLNADIHDGYVLCLDGSCVPNSSGEFSLYLVGGTSASTPSFAGIMALVDQQMTSGPQTFRQGLANYILYKLASSETLSQCNGSNTTTLPNATCIFNDVTIGNNAVPGELNYGLPSAQYQAGTGYDMATGLGSVNIANLVTQWASLTFNASTTTLHVTPSSPSSIVHGQPATVNITVAASHSGGSPPTPTGDVSLIASLTSNTNALGFFSLVSGAVTNGSLSDLPGGTYTVFANYAGDTYYGGSQSNTVPVTVTPEASTTAVSVLTADANGNPISFTGGPFGSFVYLRADVAGNSGHGTPTGNVKFTDSFGRIPGGGTFALNSGSTFQSGATATTPNGIFTFDTGTHSISASFAGDASFNPSNSPASAFTITPGFFASSGNSIPTVTISAPGGSGSLSLSVSYSTGFSGTISLSCSGMPAGAACAFSPASITGNGKLTTTASTIKISTTAATSAALPSTGDRGFHYSVAFGGFMVFSIVLAGIAGRRREALILSLLLVLLPGCGGGGSKATTPSPPVVTPTPAGSYSITVNATSGSTTYETGFTLLVE